MGEIKRSGPQVRWRAGMRLRFARHNDGSTTSLTVFPEFDFYGQWMDSEPAAEWNSGQYDIISEPCEYPKRSGPHVKPRVGMVARLARYEDMTPRKDDKIASYPPFPVTVVSLNDESFIRWWSEGQYDIIRDQYGDTLSTLAHETHNELLSLVGGISPDKLFEDGFRAGYQARKGYQEHVDDEYLEQDLSLALKKAGLS